MGDDADLSEAEIEPEIEDEYMARLEEELKKQ